jgi:hypothetical protein
MRLLVFLGLYEGEKAIATFAAEQLLRVLDGHDVDVLIQDDGSPSHVGRLAAKRLSERTPGRLDVVRLERPGGFHGTGERAINALSWVARSGRHYDYVLRTDADLHFCRLDLRRLFEPGLLPTRGIVGEPMTMRPRDYVLVLADILPVGFRRRRTSDGTIEHAWQFSRWHPVWWQTIGLRALRRGFRGRIIPASFLAISGRTLSSWHECGWLDPSRTESGLIFADDTLLAIMTRALGDPVVDVASLLSDWSADFSVTPATTALDVRRRGHYMVHPLKDVDWANRLRAELPLC